MNKISPKARVGKNVEIGDFCVIHDNVEIGDNVIVESHCVLGKPSPLSDGSPLKIGADSIIRTHSVFYEGSQFGEGLKTGHHATVREKTKAGVGLQIGTFADIQGSLSIGDHTRIHSGVFICQGTTLGSYVWIFPHVVFTDDPHPPSATALPVTVEDYAAVGAGSVLLPGVRIGTAALIGAGSVVSKNVPAHFVAVGSPAKVVCETKDVRMKDGSNAPAYPWMTRFHRGYPEEFKKKWLGQSTD